MNTYIHYGHNVFDKGTKCRNTLHISDKDKESDKRSEQWIVNPWIDASVKKEKINYDTDEDDFDVNNISNTQKTKEK